MSNDFNEKRKDELFWVKLEGDQIKMIPTEASFGMIRTSRRRSLSVSSAFDDYSFNTVYKRLSVLFFIFGVCVSACLCVLCVHTHIRLHRNHIQQAALDSSTNTQHLSSLQSPFLLVRFHFRLFSWRCYKSAMLLLPNNPSIQTVNCVIM